MADIRWGKKVLNVFPDAVITTVHNDWQRVTFPENSQWNNHELRIRCQRHRFRNQVTREQKFVTTWFVEDDYWCTRITRTPDGILNVFHEVREETTTLGLKNCKHSRERHERHVEVWHDMLAGLT
jgi:hypothetical protein